MRFNTGRTRKSQFHPKSYIYSFMKNFRRISRGPIVQRIPWYFFLSFPAAENAENGWFPNHFRLSRSSLWHHRMTWRSFFRGWKFGDLIYWLIRNWASCKKGFKNGCLGYRFWGWNSKNQGFIGIIFINQKKDPHEPTRIQWKAVSFFFFVVQVYLHLSSK